MMKRLVSWLFFIGLAVVVAALVLPGFIDWTRHKDLLVNELSARLGQDVRIDGTVSLRLLPNPHLSLENVRIGSADKDKYLVALGALDARMSLDALLQGRFVVDSIHLQEPVINIAIDATGSNWAPFWAARGAEEAASGAVVALKQVTLSHARVVYHNAATGQRWDIPRLNMTMSADSLSGPYRARGDALYDDDAPVTFVLETGARRADSALPFTLDVQPIEDFPQVRGEGMFNPAAPDVTLSLALSARAGKAIDLLRPFTGTQGLGVNVPALMVAGETEVTVEVGRDVAFKNLKVAAKNGAALAGDIVYRAQDLRLDSDVTLTRPDIYWLSFKGKSDIVRATHTGDAYVKLQNLSGFAPFTPDVAVEAQGLLSYAGAESWSLDNATLTLPEWQQQWQGRVQRVGGQAVAFALSTARAGVAGDVSLNGQFAQTMQADGTATLFGHALPFSLSGAPDRPDIKIDLSAVAPHDVVMALGAGATGVALEGGTSALTGQLDLRAATPAAALSGQVAVAPQKIKLSSFAPAALEAALRTMTAVPDDLAAQLHAAATGGDSVLAAKPLTFTLPVTAPPGWTMAGLAYEGGTLDVSVAAGHAGVTVTAGKTGVLSYKAALPLSDKDMPVAAAQADILSRHPPVPEVDTNAAIGDILNRLEDVPDTPPPQDVPAMEGLAMPPQPVPALPEVEVAPPPPLPDDTPLMVEPRAEPAGVPDDLPQDSADEIPADEIPDEIFPLDALPVEKGE